MALWDWMTLLLYLSGNMRKEHASFISVILFFFFFFLRATPVAYGHSQARDHHSHSNTGSKPHLRPTPWFTATPDALPTERGQGSNLSHNGNSRRWGVFSQFLSRKISLSTGLSTDVLWEQIVKMSLGQHKPRGGINKIIGYPKEPRGKNVARLGPETSRTFPLQLLSLLPFEHALIFFLFLNSGMVFSGLHGGLWECGHPSISTAWDTSRGWPTASWSQVSTPRREDLRLTVGLVWF